MPTSLASAAAPRLVLIAPSRELGGGIERAADAVARAWPGPIERIDMLTSARSRPDTRAKVVLAVRAALSLWSSDGVFVLVVHSGLLPAVAGIAAVRRRPLGLYGMGTEVWGPMGGAERWSVRACQRLLAISSFTGDRMAERSGIDRSRVSVVHLPVAEALLAHARQECGCAPAEARLLTVSRLVREHRYKGHFDVATALQTVLRESPSVRWVVIGEGPDRPRLEERCAALGIRGSVDFLGSVSDERLAAEYRRATALVLPSVADARLHPPVGEGFGLVYAEAGAFGVPSIAHRRGGGALDYVRDGETGLTIDDPETLAAAALRMVREPELRDRLGAAARALTFERHTTERFARALERALRG